ncbi:hypothetical protein CK203_085354 [Vitis vinifera]|uniref:Reverse transcriptase zinc-binding domain-containing protein n=1 Tax=Vitis vinifera TaxID=29760 RepID=A0A438DD00_VITVI|nr:hypothetical protein CK203_085354 [Vitis vinifera]
MVIVETNFAHLLVYWSITVELLKGKFGEEEGGGGQKWCHGALSFCTSRIFGEKGTRGWSGWKGGNKGVFSDKGLYSVLETGSTTPLPLKIVGNPWIPSKASFFTWEACWGKVLTLDQLQERGWTLANGCALCKVELETIDHIFLHCDKARLLWQLVFSIFGVWWVIFETIGERCIKAWTAAPTCVFWTLWKERNKSFLIHLTLICLLVSIFWQELADHTVEVNVQHEVLDGMFTFYDSTKARLNIYQVASVTFDLLLLLVLGSYLIVLFSFLVITTRVFSLFFPKPSISFIFPKCLFHNDHGLDDLISLFRRPPSRKLKTA